MTFTLLNFLIIDQPEFRQIENLHIIKLAAKSKYDCTLYFREKYFFKKTIKISHALNLS